MIQQRRILEISEALAKGDQVLSEDADWMLKELDRRRVALENYNAVSRENSCAYIEVARRALDLSAILRGIRAHPEDRAKLAEVRRALSELARMPAPGKAIAERLDQLEALASSATPADPETILEV